MWTSHHWEEEMNWVLGKLGGKDQLSEAVKDWAGALQMPWDNRLLGSICMRIVLGLGCGLGMLLIDLAPQRHLLPFACWGLFRERLCSSWWKSHIVPTLKSIGKKAHNVISFLFNKSSHTGQCSKDFINLTSLIWITALFSSYPCFPHFIAEYSKLKKH